MKKFLRDLLIAFVGMTIVLFILWNISWITEWKQVLLIYGILGAVIVVETLCSVIIAKIKQ